MRTTSNVLPVLTRRVLLAASGAACIPSRAIGAEAWPARPIRWVVAYPAGGGADFLARQLAPQLGRRLGQTIVIDNRPGAAGIIGTDNAAKSPPDGYTLLTGDNGAMVFNSALYRKLPYAPTDFAPVGFMARFPLILVAAPQAGFRSARQLLAAVSGSPGAYSYASPGVGSPHHLAMELLKSRTRSFVVHIPYRGTAPAVQDLMSGQVQMMVLDTAAGLPLIRAGKVHALAILAAHRAPTLPDVPTLAEAGVPGFEASAWQALFVPRGTPPDIVARLNAEMAKAIETPEVKARLEDFGLEVAPSDADSLAGFLEREQLFWHTLIRERKLASD